MMTAFDNSTVVSRYLVSRSSMLHPSVSKTNKTHYVTDLIGQCGRRSLFVSWKVSTGLLSTESDNSIQSPDSLYLPTLEIIMAIAKGSKFSLVILSWKSLYP